MNPHQKKYILENAGKKSVQDLARELGLKERKVKRFIEKEGAVFSGKAMTGDRRTEGPGFMQTLFRKDGKAPLVGTGLFLVVFLAALIVRAVYLYQIRSNPFFEPFHHGLDDYLYDTWAREIAAGDVLGKGVFYGLPLYPYFLGLVYFLFGHSVLLAKAVQLSLGAVSCGLVYLIGARIFTRPVGVMAGLMLAFYNMAIFFEGFFVSAFLSIFLNCLAVLVLVSAAEKPRPVKWAGAGFLVGLSALANASALIFAALLLPWAYAASAKSGLKRLAGAAGLLLGVVLAIAPVTLRNYAVSGDIVPITAHGGITFYAGNNPLSDGTFKLPKAIGTSVMDSRSNAERIAEQGSGKKLRPSEVSGFWFDKGMAYIRENPLRYAALAARKMALFWNAREIPDVLPLSFFKQYSSIMRLPLVNYAVLLPFAMFGMLLCARYRTNGVTVLYLLVLAVFISTSVYFVNSRYRLAAVPPLCLFAAAALYWFYYKVRSGKIRDVIPPAALVAALFVLTGIRLHEASLAQAHNNLGIILKRKGLQTEAVAEYKKAIELEPGYDSPYFNLGLLYFEKGDNKEAVDLFERALRVNPRFIKAHNYLGKAYMREGKKEEALSHWQASLAIDPGQEDIRELLSGTR